MVALVSCIHYHRRAGESRSFAVKACGASPLPAAVVSISVEPVGINSGGGRQEVGAELLRQRFAGEDAPDDVVDVVGMQADRNAELAHVTEETLGQPT